MSKAIYLAGPMTGKPHFNFPLFESTARELRALGWNIISPAELNSEAIHQAAAASTDGKLDSDGKVGGQTWGDLLSRDVKIVADACDGIALLPDWETSRGAKLEAFVGLMCKHQFYEVNFFFPSGKCNLFPAERHYIAGILKSNLIR